MENQNVKKAIRLEFKNAKGNIVPELSAFPAEFQQIQAAMLFLGTGNSFTVSVEDFVPDGAK